MRFRALIVIVSVVALAVVLWLLRSSPEDWAIRNLPIEPGPVVCFGDSLVAGVGASSQESTYPAQLARLLNRRVVPAGVSGQTTRGGLRAAQAGASLRAPLVVITLGGNDILRRRPLEETEEALGGLFDLFQSRGAVVAYTEVLGLMPGRRAEMHRRVCKAYGVIFIPDVLDGILAADDLTSDSIHPNDDGYRLVAERVAAALLPYLESQVGAAE